MFDTVEGALLRQPARPVSLVEIDMVVDLSVSMLGMLDGLSAVGLAAPQVGVPFSFFVYRFGGAQGVVVNPVRRVRSFLVRQDEMCLSLPDVRSRPYRPGLLVVDGCSLVGRRLVPQVFELSGFAAQVFDHEIDHLEGVSMLDRESPSA